jgi:hypothetical protein
MTNNKKSPLMLTTLAILIGAFLLSPFLGKANPAAASPVGAATPSSFAVYLPLVMNDFPIQTIFGAGMDQITSGGGLDQMSAANMSWTRPLGVVWSSVESTQGSYNWSALSGLESELQNASHLGIQVILLVHSTPQWARKIAGTGPSCGPISQSKLPAFGNFMRALVARYSVAPYNVKYWELWNEPDIDASLFTGDSGYGCWGDPNDAYYGGGSYADMLKVVYPQIKAADPQGKVLVGGLLLDCDPRGSPSGCATLHPTNPYADRAPKFLEGILRNNGAPYFDGISFHAYDYYDYVTYSGSLGQYGNGAWQSAWNSTGPVMIAKTEFIQSVLSSYTVSGKFLMNTEAALVCGTFEGAGSYCQTEDFETTKAYYVAQVYAAAIAQGLRANIWYSVLGWRNSGLLNADLSPRPAYTAFKIARRELRDAVFVGEITEYAGVMGYKFQRGNRRIWVLWSLDGNPHSITLSSVPLAAWDALGVSVIPASSMNITLNPLYLESDP